MDPARDAGDTILTVDRETKGAYVAHRSGWSWAIAVSTAMGVGSGAAGAGCNAPSTEQLEAQGTKGTSAAGLTEASCGAVAESARVAARHRRLSAEEVEQAGNLAYIECALTKPSCKCDAEKECREVARGKLERWCWGHPPFAKVTDGATAELAHCLSICSGPPEDLEGCASQVSVRTDLTGKAREVAYQRDIAAYCASPGLSACTTTLIARANVDYTSAANQLLARQITPGQYLAVSQDRSRKLRVAEDSEIRATELCTATDADGDWVIDREDRCPNTPDLTPTDDSGCPLKTIPAGPSADEVAAGLSALHITINPKCAGAFVPERVPAGGFYWPAYSERGTYILAGAISNQPAGCPVWYEFDIEEISGPQAGFRYTVAFRDQEANADLVDLHRPVPAGLIQFNPLPTDPVPNRVRLAETGFHAGIRYRVRGMNGNGLRGPWSDWKISDKASCTALGFTCGDSY